MPPAAVPTIPEAVKPMLWDPIGALAEYDSRISLDLRPPITGLNLSRLLHLKWITIQDIKDTCTEDDLNALRKYRMKCLQAGGAQSGGKRFFAGDIFLGLGEKRLNIGGGSGAVKWEDGERPWKIRWPDCAGILPKECLDYVFNAKPLPADGDGKMIEVMKRFIPDDEDRDKFAEKFEDHFAAFDKAWIEKMESLEADEKCS